MEQTIEEEARELVEAEFCGNCRLGCNMQDTCDGFKEEVEEVMKDMAD